MATKENLNHRCDGEFTQLCLSDKLVRLPESSVMAIA